jgi:hypothetical protein
MRLGLDDDGDAVPGFRPGQRPFGGGCWRSAAKMASMSVMAPLPRIGMHEAFGIVGIGRQIGVIGIAVGEMAEGREDEIAIVPPTAQMT